MLARICERVSGEPFATFCRTRIFEPLGMSRTVINDFFMRLIPGRASGYYEDGQGGWINAPLSDSVVGPTNVYTTVEDLARWDENFYTAQIGGRSVLERVLEPGCTNDGTILDYAFGLMVGPTHKHRGWQMVEHGGGQGDYGAWMVRFPELHLSVAVLFNRFLWDAREYALRVADLFLQDRPDLTEEDSPPREVAPLIELSAEQLATYTGTYFSARRAALREVTISEGKLQFQGLDLVPVGDLRFAFAVEPETYVAFVREGDTIVGLQTLTPSGAYGYERVEHVSPTSDQLGAFVGRYYSPELDIYWTLALEEGALKAHRRKYTPTVLTPLFRDTFSDDWTSLMGYPTRYLVDFEREAGDRITGLRVSGLTGVRHLWFERVT